ncbi:MAG: benzoate-CoA ligase family protein [Deltaproteobacteria bacterium]|nr:benzoate-CoA ligase family protein [Deltaproteobacteria bacterium]
MRTTSERHYNAAADLLDRHLVEGRAERIAYRDDHGTYTYAELARRVDATGRALGRLGIEPEQRVLMVMLDSIDFVATFLGAIKIGVVPVPVSTMLKPTDYAYFLADSRARAVVVSDPLLASVEGATPPTLRHVVTTTRLRDLVASERSEPLEAAATSPDDVAFWLYSSGSTGSPKGAMHLHAHLRRTATLYAEGVLGIRPDDVVFSAAKLFFAYGLGNALTFPLAVGASAVLTSERPTPAVVARIMREAKPTIFCGVPTLFASLLADADIAKNGLSPALRVSTSAGEGLPRHIGESWRARFGSDILDGIGSTEMLHIFLSNRPGDVRYGTTGKPVPGYDLELRGEDGRSVASGEDGALWVRGPTAAAGYWNQREKSLATFHGPWTRTGDNYVRDDDGYYTYSGRSDDMLKVGGIWVSPFEVESALCAHPSVLEAAVIGAEDPDGLVKPKAFVVPKPGASLDAAELKAFVKDRIAPFKYPRWIEVVDELPKTATGKIQRFKLRGGDPRG